MDYYVKITNVQYLLNNTESFLHSQWYNSGGSLIALSFMRSNKDIKTLPYMTCKYEKYLTRIMPRNKYDVVQAIMDWTVGKNFLKLSFCWCKWKCYKYDNWSLFYFLSTFLPFTCTNSHIRSETKKKPTFPLSYCFWVIYFKISCS